MRKPSSPALTRRGVLTAGGAAALAGLLSACGGTDDAGASSGASAATGPWEFTDDRNEKVTSPAAPVRVVAFTGAAAALVDFGLDKQIVGVFGETKKADGAADPQAGDLDVGAVTVIGNAWGEFSVEKYAGLRPELLITHMYDPGALWYVPDESKDKILALAPSVAVTTARKPLIQVIGRYAELAGSLGADLNAEKVTAAKARFDAAAETLRAATAANKGIKVLAASGSPDLFYVSHPKTSSDLAYFAELGVELIVPEKTDGGDYYEGLSWENADKYGADLILLDSRSTALQPKDLTAKPTWNELPAVKANQITPWDAVPRFSWAGSAPLVERLAQAVQKAKKVS